MPASGYSTSGVVTTPALPAATLVVPEIDEIQFPPEISEGMIGGLMFSTIVVVAGNGTEQRQAEWIVGRYKFDISPGIKSQADARILVSFFACRTGKFRGFRVKDWTDYAVTDEALEPTGVPTVQLVKTYTDGLLSYERTIFKPIAGVTLKRNSSSYTAFTLDTTSGIITLTPLITKIPSAITKASSLVATVGSGHGFVDGDVVYFSGIGGMIELDGQTGTVTSHDTTHITVNINSTGYTTFTSGGAIEKYVQPSDTLEWTGEFDVPMRFEVDEMQMDNQSTFATWSRVGVIELLGDEVDA